MPSQSQPDCWLLALRGAPGPHQEDLRVQAPPGWWGRWRSNKEVRVLEVLHMGRTGSTSTLEPLERLQGRMACPSSHGRSLLPAGEAATLCAPGAPAPIPPLTSPLTSPCGRHLGSMKERPHRPSQGRELPCSGVVGVCSCGRWRRGDPRSPGAQEAPPHPTSSPASGRGLQL